MPETIYMITSNGELYHHGIKGQKWGVRRFQNPDGSLTMAGKARQASGTRKGKASKKDSTANDRDHSKSNKSPLVKFLASVALDVATLNVIGLGDDIVRAVQAGESYVKSKVFDKDREGCKTDKTTGLLRKKRDMTDKEDLARVNPNVHNFDTNTKNNCMLCTATYDLRRRGFEVRAKKASFGYRIEELLAWYPKAKLHKIEGIDEKGKSSTKAMMEKVKSELVRQGNGARGNLMIYWRGTRGGHSVAYEVVGGQLRIVDAQINKVYKNPDSFLRRCRSEVSYARLDNISFDPRTIKEVAE